MFHYPQSVRAFFPQSYSLNGARDLAVMGDLSPGLIFSGPGSGRDKLIETTGVHERASVKEAVGDTAVSTRDRYSHLRGYNLEKGNTISQISNPEFEINT